MLWKVVEGRRWLVANGLFVKGSWRLAVMLWEAVVMSGFLLLKCLVWNSLCMEVLMVVGHVGEGCWR